MSKTKGRTINRGQLSSQILNHNSQPAVKPVVMSKANGRTINIVKLSKQLSSQDPQTSVKSAVKGKVEPAKLPNQLSSPATWPPGNPPTQLSDHPATPAVRLHEKKAIKSVKAAAAEKRAAEMKAREAAHDRAVKVFKAAAAKKSS